MTSLRSKLFVSIGAILFGVALLNYFLPEVLVRKDIAQAGRHLSRYFDELQKKIDKAVSSLAAYRMVQSAVALSEIVNLASVEYDGQKLELGAMTPLRQASELAAYNPQIAFVQISNKEGEAVVVPEDANLYLPQWTMREQGKLWVKIPNRSEFFSAVPMPGSNTFLLYKTTDPNAARSEYSIPKAPQMPAYKESVGQMYAKMLQQQDAWVKKIDLIQLLAASMGRTPRPSGILKLDNAFQQGVSILADEAFPEGKVYSLPSTGDQPVVFLRKTPHGQDLDIVRVIDAPQGGEWTVGFSMLPALKQIASTLQRPIVISKQGEFALGVTPQGSIFEPQKALLSLPSASGKTISWQGQDYISDRIDLHLAVLYILTPAAEANAIHDFLMGLRDRIETRISLILFGAAVISLVLALVVLANISKKITQPIAVLAKASDDLGHGKYDQIVLPKLEGRKDEIAVFTHSFENMVVALRDRDKIRGVLNKVVSKEICEEILKHNVELGGEERTLTMLFSDIRGFTHLSENRPPKEIIGMLNAYMTRMCRIIDQSHGVVDKFVGDEIMALYGAPLPMEGHAVRAIETAQHMVQDLKSWNQERSQRGETTFEIGIGIHTGVVCCGNMGAEDRLNYTVIGSNVNLAARLCQNAAPMQILISEATYNEPGVKEQFHINHLPEMTFKGIDHPVNVYEVLTT